MLPADLPDLPVRAVLPEVARSVADHGAAVLVAPPGTGKTTLVPFALAADVDGRVVVAEPRRLAARAAASRMAALLGEPVGRTVGYAIRGDRRSSRDTRVEVVTSGLLVRRLQHDPSLPGVSAVMLDEVHERHLDADLLLSLLLDARAGLREDLRLLATSATVATDRLATLLGADTPVVECVARTHPVTVTHVPPTRGERLERHVARTVHLALSEGDGDVLVFLPGAGEIARVTAALPGVQVVPLHGRLPTDRQDAALRRGVGRRVVLATAVAESSLTVPGVRAVVDAGLARASRTDHRRGMSGLVTTRVSASVADQRAGRAGREAPGRVYRCWPAHEHTTLPPHPDPEIRTTDLTRLALELACWGTPDGTALTWWDPPPPGALTAARQVLTALGALTPTGTVTEHGHHMAAVGLHPRLSRALLDGARQVGPTTAAEVVALLDDDTLATGPSAEDALRRLRADPPPRWRQEVKRLKTHLPRDPRTTATLPASAATPHHSANPTHTPTTSPTGGPGHPTDTSTSGHTTAADPTHAPTSGITRRTNHPVDTSHASATPPANGPTPNPTDAPATRSASESATPPPPSSPTTASAPAATSTHTPTESATPPPPTNPSPAVTSAAAFASSAGRGSGFAGDVAVVVALAYPERVARRRAVGSAVYLMAGGTAAELADSGEWLAVASVERRPGRAQGTIRLAARADQALAEWAASALLSEGDEVAWVDGDVVARHVRRLGAIVVRERALARPDPELVRAALADGVRTVGLSLLTWSDAATRLRQRLALLRRVLGAPWPDVSDAALLDALPSWLGPALAKASRRADLARVDVHAALSLLLPWPAAARLDELAPDRLPVPSGARIRVDYGEDDPALPVKLQETFGWRRTPTIVDGRVPVTLRLLSPAGRPVAITRDLENFWRDGYHQVRAELRGRYPKHPWPEDPTTATPTARTTRRSM